MDIEQEILNIINKNTCITIDQLMEIALSSRHLSYYKTKYAIGANNDFITAPEISQMFGEIIAIWSILKWRDLGQKAFNLVELGPGRGTLMSDLLRCATRIAPEFIQAISQLTFLEINPYLIKLQREKLAKFNIPIQRINTIDELESDVSIIIANEFFDALPIKQYQNFESNWYEVVVKHKNQLYFDLNTKSTKVFSQHIHARHGSIIELNHQTISIILHLCNIMKKHSGATLVIDYGYCYAPDLRKASQYNSSLQAVKSHRFHPVLTNIGNADLTAHVDFAAIKAAVLQSGIKNINLTTQAEFLHQYGIKHRLENMIEHNTNLSAMLIKQYRYLTYKMGFLFKVLDFSIRTL